jgi:hypothetical protein
MKTTSYQPGEFNKASFSLFIDPDGIWTLKYKDISDINLIVSDYEFLRSLINDQKVCVVIDTTNSGLFSEQKIEFAKMELGSLYKAVAVFSNTAAGKLAGSIMSALIPFKIPTATFTSEKEAKNWLRNHL